MRVTIIPADGVMLVDGRAIHGIDLSDIPANIHAVQWGGSGGHVEYTDRPNSPLTDIAEYQIWLDRWETARQVEDVPRPPLPRDIKAEIAAIEAATLTPRGTREFMLMYFEATFTAEQLAANPGYQKAKAVDNQIKALRSLL